MIRINRTIKKLISNKKAFTLLEVLVSVLILASIVTPILSMFVTSFRNTAFSQKTTGGVYTAQAAMESTIGLTYSEILNLPSARQAFDSDADGTNDCFVQIRVYPEGSHDNLASSSKVSYLHIIYDVSTLMIFGDDGTSTSVPVGNINLQIEQALCTLTVGSNTLAFSKKSSTNDLIVIVNMINKQYGSTYSLSITGADADNAILVQYALTINTEEVTFSPAIDIDNIYLGVNNFNTALVHVDVSVFEDDDADTEFSSMGNTIEVIIRTVS